MAPKFFSFLILFSILIAAPIPLALAKDSPNVAYVKKTCNDATYVALCLNTLLPEAGRINSHPKESTRLAIMAVTPQVQSTSNNISHLAKQPHLWTREINSLNDCASNINSTAPGLQAALELTNHLGGGTKAVKETKRVNMENDVNGVVRATNTCVKNLISLRTRNDVVSRVNELTDTLIELATNAVNLIHRMEF